AAFLHCVPDRRDLRSGEPTIRAADARADRLRPRLRRAGLSLHESRRAAAVSRGPTDFRPARRHQRRADSHARRRPAKRPLREGCFRLKYGDRSIMILQIHRDTLKPGTEAAFDAIERDAARACRGLNCPHPHVAIVAITAPAVRGAGAPEVKEVWWLNLFASNDEKQRVYAAYASNAPLMAALGDVGTRRHDVIASEVDVFATYCADLSRGAEWRVAGARFFVVLVTARESRMDGVV